MRNKFSFFFSDKLSLSNLEWQFKKMRIQTSLSIMSLLNPKILVSHRYHSWNAASRFVKERKKTKYISSCRAVCVGPLVVLFRYPNTKHGPLLFSLWYNSSLYKFLCIIQCSLFHLIASNHSPRPTLDEA